MEDLPLNYYQSHLLRYFITLAYMDRHNYYLFDTTVNTDTIERAPRHYNYYFSVLAHYNLISITLPKITSNAHLHNLLFCIKFCYKPSIIYITLQLNRIRRRLHNYNSKRLKWSKTIYNKKGQHRSCHTAKCNMLNKWLKTTKILYWSLIISPPYTSNMTFSRTCAQT